MPVFSAAMSVRSTTAAALTPMVMAMASPATFAEIMQSERLIVWQGASDKTIFGDACVNHAFRAWHDANHIAGLHDFTLAGELATMRAQQRDMFNTSGDNATTRLCARIIQAEVQGQAEYFARTGAFPIDQIAFTTEYLKCSTN